MGRLVVKEIFGPTIQGEGGNTGRPCVFIRFAGCNAWNGQPETKEKSLCPYCDTDFTGGTVQTVSDIASKVETLCDGQVDKYLIVISGGEPLLQNEFELGTLVRALSFAGYETQVETNGTVNNAVVEIIDTVTCSPKVPVDNIKLLWAQVDELKVLYPHPNPKITPESFRAVLQLNPSIKPFLQPIERNGTMNITEVVQKVIELGEPWRISLQTHKLMGVE